MKKMRKGQVSGWFQGLPEMVFAGRGHRLCALPAVKKLFQSGKALVWRMEAKKLAGSGKTCAKGYFLALIFLYFRDIYITQASWRERETGMEHNWILRGREVLDIEIEGIRATRDRLDEAFAQAVGLLAGCTGRVAVMGVGKSGLVGRKIAATLSSTGTPAFFLHPVEGAHGDLGSIREQDVVLAISYSGTTAELAAILPAIRSMGAKIIGITSGRDSALAILSDVVLDCTIPREACPMNLAPTSSTTATLALGDALAVCLIDKKNFTARDFKKFHPGGALGARLSGSVADVMHRENLPLAPDTALLAEALRIQDSGGFGAVVFTDAAGMLAGILTDGDVRRLAARGGLYPDRPAREVMVASPLRARPDESAAKVMDTMEQKAITLLPVVDAAEKVVGVVHIHDILGKGTINFSGAFAGK